MFILFLKCGLCSAAHCAAPAPCRAVYGQPPGGERFPGWMTVSDRRASYEISFKRQMLLSYDECHLHVSNRVACILLNIDTNMLLCKKCLLRLFRFSLLSLATFIAFTYSIEL